MSEVTQPFPPPSPLIIKGLLGPNKKLADLDWKPFREGVEVFRIYGDERKGPAAALLRYQPGSGVPYHEHSGYELILVLEETQRYENGGEAREGTLIVNQPGSGHTVHTKTGCIVLVVWQDAIVLPPE